MSLFAMARAMIESYIHEKMTRENILNLQEKKFRKMLNFAYVNSKFYNKLYSSKGIQKSDLSTIDIDKIPIVDKDLIIDNFDDVVIPEDITKKEILEFLEKSKDPNDLFKDKYHVIHTSGSSGKIGYFLYSKNEWDYLFTYLTKLFKFNFTKKKVAFVGATGGHFTAASSLAWVSNTGITKLFCKPLVLNINRPLDENIEKLNDFQPDVVSGYFNSLKILAEKQEQGVLHISPKHLVSSGEGITQIGKRYIEKIFNIPLLNMYAFSECFFLGIGKDEYNGIYLRDDLALIEIKDNHLLLTNLINKTQPIIRYRIDDYLKEKNDLVKKLPFTLIDDVVGRDEATIWLENDQGTMDFIHPLIMADFYVKGLDKLQIVLNDKKSFDLKIVIKDIDEKTVLEETKNKMDAILAEKNFNNVKYIIKIVQNIPIDKKTGKFKLVMKQESYRY
jgi:phenylacetate-CoA ligase